MKDPENSSPKDNKTKIEIINEQAKVIADLEFVLKDKMEEEREKEFIGSAVMGADLLFKTASVLIGKMASEDGDELVENIKLTTIKVYESFCGIKGLDYNQAFELTKVVLPQLIQQPR